MIYKTTLKIGKFVALLTSMAMVFTISASAATVGNNIQTSTYVYDGITYNIEKSTLTDGSIQVDVTSPNESDNVIYNQNKNTFDFTQTLQNSQNSSIKNTTERTINLNNISKPTKPTIPTSFVNKSHSGKISPQYTSSGEVYNLEWGFDAYYSINTSIYGTGKEYYYLYTPDKDGGYHYYDTVTIGSTEYQLCNSFYSDVATLNSNWVTVYAILGSGETALIAGLITGAATAGIGAIIAALAALGLGSASVGYIYTAWTNAQAADKVFDELCANY